MRGLVSLGGASSIALRPRYSLYRIRHSAKMWTGRPCVSKDILQRCRYWTSVAGSAECRDAVRELLKPVCQAIPRPLTTLVVTVYPVPGPASRIGGQAFAEESCIEVWCAHLDRADFRTFAATIAHETAHLMLIPLIRKVMIDTERPVSRAPMVSEVLCRALTGFPPGADLRSPAGLILTMATSLFMRAMHPSHATLDVLVSHALKSLTLAEIRLVHQGSSYPAEPVQGDTSHSAGH